MPLQTAVLKDNFLELYSALHTSSPRQLNLVANYSGTRIYNSTRGWGRLWRLFYQVTGFAFHGNQRLAKLKQAIVHTHKLFQNQLPQVQTHIDNYLAYMRQASGGYVVNENKMHADRKAILAWDNATKRFLKYFRNQTHRKLHHLIHSCCNSKASLFTTPLTVPVKMCSRIIALEGISTSSLPLEAIKKLLKQKPIHALETKKLKQWIDKLNQQPSHLNTIFKGFSSITNFFNIKKTDAQKNYQPESLCLALERYGCTVFDKSDPKQLAWRNQIWKTGAVIQNGPSLLAIGKQIGHSASRTNNTAVFDLPSSPASMALVPPNRVILSLTKARTETSPIPFARIMAIMDKGRWALIERLFPLNAVPWQSKHLPLVNEDLPKANALASLMKTCIETSFTPPDLSPAMMMFDAQGLLKSLYPTTKRPFDFNALENFAYRSARGNLAVFQHLMNTSGLADHTIAKYYMAIITGTLKKEPMHIVNLGGIYRIGDSKVIDKAASLAKEISQLQTEINLSLQEKYPEHDPKTLEKHIAASLLSHYRSHRTASFLWPALAKSIIKAFSDSKKLTPETKQI